MNSLTSIFTPFFFAKKKYVPLLPLSNQVLSVVLLNQVSVTARFNYSKTTMRTIWSLFIIITFASSGEHELDLGISLIK